MTTIDFPPVQTPYFTDEEALHGSQKAQIYLDWGYFIQSGFEYHAFTMGLYQFLVSHCKFIAHSNHQFFWQTYFDYGLQACRAFLRQFGGDRCSAEFPSDDWLQAPYRDLKLAMCQRMAQVYEPITTVLDDLERNHQNMVVMWFEFAQRNNIQSLPAEDYRITANTRSLLRYCLAIALERQLPEPSFQQIMPFIVLPANGQTNGPQMTLFNEVQSQ